MRLSRSLLGKYIEITWSDPGDARNTLSDPTFKPRGRGCLATWKERGVLVDITDGVVTIEHSHATGAPLLKQPDEECVVYVVEDLILGWTVYEPAKEVPA